MISTYVTTYVPTLVSNSVVVMDEMRGVAQAPHVARVGTRMASQFYF